jgi:hypothetical protein
MHCSDVQSKSLPQDLPAAHAPHVPPPQSTSVSAPFLTESEQPGTWHTFPVHTPDVQSALMRQDFTLAHAAHVPPPQSMSVSSPFFTESEQLGAWHTFPVHTPDAQSPATVHTFAAAHVPHVPPPQSTSVSPPFFTESEQLGAWHTFPVHTPDAQSAASVHTFVAAHVPHVPPPQSTSVSSPFFTPSVQVAAAQLPAVHTPEAHWLPQLPQLAGSAETLFSQPLEAVESQLAKFALHDAMPHAPDVQEAVPFATLHALLQAPQWDRLVDTFVSQPLEAVESQLPNPELQVEMPQVDAAHPAVALARLPQALPQFPQFWTSVAVSTHAAEQTTWPAPQHVEGVPVQVKPFSVAQEDEQPSPSDVFPSSHVSGPSTVPLPQPLTHWPPAAQT